MEETLEAYRKAKWAELADSGEDHVRRELADLERFLETAEDHDWASDQLIAFRQAKARILREVLAEAEG